MLVSLQHRGPDGFGVYLGNRCVLGHARLGIIDIEGGQQPIFNEDGRLAITFNGEIYNYLELREELESRGHRFYTKTDTEIIVHAYEEWGRDCPKRFNGQFAFAVYDKVDHSLFLARDRLGICPLFYGWNGELFVFGSEVKAIFASRFVAPELFMEGLDEVFIFWANSGPNTPFAGIYELPPSSTIIITQHKTSVKQYWKIPTGEDWSLSPEYCIEGVFHHLRRSVSLRLRADVPVGAYLSGGLDSGLTAAIIRHFTNTPIRTFSVEFEDPMIDESPHQRDIVRFLGSAHSAILCGPDDIAENLVNVVWAAEKPIFRTAPVPMYILARLVRSEGYKVVLTGEGADEFFLGYDIFKEAKARAFCARSPQSVLRPLILRKLYPDILGDSRAAKFQEAFFLKRFQETPDPFYGHRVRWMLSKNIRNLYTDWASDEVRIDPEKILLENLPADFPTLPPLMRTQITEIATILSGYLLSSQGDRMLMANSIEGRYAFLDHELIEFASRIPAARKMPGMREKSILKAIGKAILTARIVNRHKFHYTGMSIANVIQSKKGHDALYDEMTADRIKDFGVFDASKVQKLLARIYTQPGTNATMTENLVLMGILSSQIFHRRFFKDRIETGRFKASDRIHFFVEEGNFVCGRR